MMMTTSNLASQLMSYIDVLIPGVIGALLLTCPRLFTKSQGETFEKAKGKMRIIGGLLLGVAALYLVLKLLQRPS